MTAPAAFDRIRRPVVAYCPRCHAADQAPASMRRLEGSLADSGGSVWLVRDCPDHGRIVTLYEEDAELLDYLEQWTAPTKPPTPDSPSNTQPVPAAYAAGLGTFGLCDGLITPRGKAMRTGSVVAQIKIDAPPRPYDDHQAYCLYFSRGTCRECISRCPVGALSENGHDKLKCLQHLKPTTAEYVKAEFGFDGYGCGLCQTGVPCESRIPDADDI